MSSLWLAPIFKFYGFNVIGLLHLYLQKKSQNPLGHSLFEFYLLKNSAKFCDYIFSVNKENQKVFGKKVKFIGNYVPEWFFEQEKTNQKKYDFIIISRLSKQKNIPLFLEIFEHLIKKYKKDYKALIIGEGEEKNNIQQIIKEKKLERYISLEGWEERKKLPNKYDLGKVFVISSYHEGFATTLLEAHARGLPAIVTKTSGFCGEFVESFGEKTGIVFDFKDVQNGDFYKKIINLVEDYYKYEEKCIKKAKNFSEENVLKPILEVLK
ncbi:Galactosyltransferase [Caminibacter mediatlanticus TB-2]|uniref:Galactosyltransferase n=1 Tax=Caminibacter mediatlanticus TB-2 TaxID=391592 RepID=A0AAI9AGC1_9BACT|nr:Galactosyltransferase [Caminibacter mediatlanticus TB-2]